MTKLFARVASRKSNVETLVQKFQSYRNSSSQYYLPFASHLFFLSLGGFYPEMRVVKFLKMGTIFSPIFKLELPELGPLVDYLKVHQTLSSYSARNSKLNV